MERAQQIFVPLMERANDKAAMIVIRAQDPLRITYEELLVADC